MVRYGARNVHILIPETPDQLEKEKSKMYTNIVVALLLLSGAILILALVLYLQFRQRQKVRAQVEREKQKRENDKKKRQLDARQNGAGNILFAELRQAAHQNKVSVSPLEVECLKQNGHLGYSIIVFIPDANCLSINREAKVAGYPILQIDINLEKTGAEIHVLKMPNGPQRDYHSGEFDMLRNELYEWVEYYPNLK